MTGNLRAMCAALIRPYAACSDNRIPLKPVREEDEHPSIR